MKSIPNLLYNKTHLNLSPPIYIGIGLKKGVSQTTITTGIEELLITYNLENHQIVTIATIDHKASEPGLLSFCQLHNLPLKTFTSAQLKNVIVPHPKTNINELIGTPSVAEAAAILAASEINNIDKLNIELLVPKQIFKLPETQEMITLAVAF